MDVTHTVPLSRARSGYLPSLDGWRAFAILAVLAVHETPIWVAGHSLQALQGYGSLGVVLFFAISGLLIPSRILEEESLTGRFHLKRFYIRRFFRIQPAAILYLATIALLTVIGVLHERWHYWLGALFLYTNFLYRESAPVMRATFYTGHFWTLAVEEHFYLLVSLFFFFIRKRRAALLVAMLLVVKIAQKVGVHYTAEPLLRRTYWQIHMLLWPTATAVLLRNGKVSSFARRWLVPGPVLLSVAFAGYLCLRHSPQTLVTFLSWSFTLCVVSTMLHSKHLATRFLELPPLRFIGRISYSLYLWHVLFFSSHLQMKPDSQVLLILSERKWKYLASLVAAVCSYYCIEKPFIRLGHRLAPPATAGHADLTTSVAKLV